MSGGGDPQDDAEGEVHLEALVASRRSRPLDEDLLDDLAARIGEMPEPVAAVAAGVEVARAEGDATGVRKRLFELGIAVVRYAVSVGLALVRERLGDQRAPRPLGEALQRATRLSDGSWCALARTVAGQLSPESKALAPAFDFLRRKALTELVTARNHFVHGGGSGDDSLELTLAVLDEAEQLLGWPLRALISCEPPSYQQRMGVPMRPGVWRKVRGAVPQHAQEGVTYVVHDLAAEERWTAVSPWIPEAERKLLLVDSPHSARASWRWFDAETGEHRECPELDAAVRSLAGDDAAAPVPPCDRPDLVGRAQAITVMRRAAELTAREGIAVVVLTGPQGIGRGRLLETLREAAASFGFDCVLEAACLEHRRGVLRPLRRAVTGQRGLDAVASALGRAAAGDALAGAEGLEAAVEAVEEALIEVSLGDPVLLLVDDLQWADESTLSLLGLLTERATRKARGRVLVVAAVRDEPNPPAALTALIGQVERDVGPGATRLELRPLDADEARKLVKGVAPLSKDLQRVLLEGAAGVPFFLVQSVLAWDETGALEWRDGAWHPTRGSVLTGPVPGVADVVQARLVSYFEAGTDAERIARQVLVSVGLAPDTLPLGQLVTTLAEMGVPAAQVENALEALVEAGVLATTAQRPEYRFAQPMVRQAVLDSHQRKPWLTRLHRALLGVLGHSESADEDAAFIARGYAELGERVEAARWLGRAVDHALTMGLFRQAVDHADRLAELADGAQERIAAQLNAVDALLRAGDAAAAKQRLARVGGGVADDAAIDVRARILAVGIALALGETADHPDRELVPSADRTGQPRLAIEARLAVAEALRAARGLALVEEAAARLEADEHGDLRYRVLKLRGELLAESRALSDPACREALERARDAAEELGSSWALLDAENDLAILATSAGDHERAMGMLRNVAKKAQALQYGDMRRLAMVNLATCALRAGQPEAAAEAAQRAAAVARKAGSWRRLGAALSVRADALRQLGDGAAARAAIDEAIDVKLRAGDPNVAIALLRRAQILAEVDELASALADAESALAQAQRVGNRDHMARARLWAALHRATREDDPTASSLRSLLEELEPSIDSLRAPTRRLFDQARERVSRQGNR